jgi:ATP-binding cassette, subfamily B, multidrug efflux pump
MGGIVGQKSMDFGPSARRLLGWLRPERAKVRGGRGRRDQRGLSAVGPKVLGRATDLIFAGVDRATTRRAE